jgi:hypothetical protein
LKNTEGYDKIPKRILKDRSDQLLTPLTELFALVYNFKQIPEQWKVAKTVRIFKQKGHINNIANYKPINSKSMHNIEALVKINSQKWRRPRLNCA